ncbi:MAG: hypothetical protein H0U21_04460 [Acidimicrobiia bacterium]|nr:hypothetical protein [Acidimicrobiia bacterium]
MSVCPIFRSSGKAAMHAAGSGGEVVNGAVRGGVVDGAVDVGASVVVAASVLVPTSVLIAPVVVVRVLAVVSAVDSRSVGGAAAVGATDDVRSLASRRNQRRTA